MLRCHCTEQLFILSTALSSTSAFAEKIAANGVCQEERELHRDIFWQQRPFETQNQKVFKIRLNTLAFLSEQNLVRKGLRVEANFNFLRVNCVLITGFVVSSAATVRNYGGACVHLADSPVAFQEWIPFFYLHTIKRKI